MNKFTQRNYSEYIPRFREGDVVRLKGGTKNMVVLKEKEHSRIGRLGIFQVVFEDDKAITVNGTTVKETVIRYDWLSADILEMVKANDQPSGVPPKLYWEYGPGRYQHLSNTDTKNNLDYEI